MKTITIDGKKYTVSDREQWLAFHESSGWKSGEVKQQFGGDIRIWVRADDGAEYFIFSRPEDFK